MHLGRPKPLTVAQQYLNLKGNPSCTGQGRLRGNTLSWGYVIAPTPLSRCYTSRIEYRQGASPEVFIDDPDLTSLSEGRRLPHVYQQRPTRLCLYLPGSYEWGSWMRLDQTIVPWTALWLFYFEEWLISGEWAGGGIHPKPARRRDCWRSKGSQSARDRASIHKDD
jgi:hypothetical protein